MELRIIQKKNAECSRLALGTEHVLESINDKERR